MNEETRQAKLNLDKALETLQAKLSPEERAEAYGLTFYEIEPNYCPTTDRTFYMEHLWLGNENDGILAPIFSNLVYWSYGEPAPDKITRDTIKMAFMETSITESLSSGEQITVWQLSRVLPRLRREYLQKWKRAIDDNPNESIDMPCPVCMPTPDCILDDENIF